MRGFVLILAVSFASAPALARESCNPKDLTKRLNKYSREQSPIYNCQVDFAAAKNCCLHPERCGGSSKDAQSILLQSGAFLEYKRLKEIDLGKCESRVKRAKISCHNDSRRKAALSREFNDVILCADDQLAKLNGRVVKSASEARYAYEIDHPRPVRGIAAYETPEQSKEELKADLREDVEKLMSTKLGAEAATELVNELRLPVSVPPPQSSAQNYP